MQSIYSNSNVSAASDRYQPAGRLVPVLSANAVEYDVIDTAIALGKKAASLGETVLILDCTNGETMSRAGIIFTKTLADVISEQAKLQDALYVTSNEHYHVACLGDLELDNALGSLAALSLEFDWVFVIAKPGCTAAHIRLAAAGDSCLLGYDTSGDAFMRAYWVIEAVRRRAPKFDPLVLSCGDYIDSVETALMLTDTVREYLGAPPPYAGHILDQNIETRLLDSLRDKAAPNAA